MTGLRGMRFVQRVQDSLLARRLAEAGWKMSRSGSEEEEKDYGDDDSGRRAIAVFECGFLFWQRNQDTLHLYQSRFRDAWALSVNGRRTTLTRLMVEIGKVDDARFLHALLDEIETLCLEKR